MWIVMKTGMISVVRHRENPNLMRVRARRREHLADTFPYHAKKIIDNEQFPQIYDYRWHLDVPLPHLIEVVGSAILNIDYDSHVKESVAGDDQQMYRAMIRTWTAFYALQEPDVTEPVSTLAEQLRAWDKDDEWDDDE